MWLIQVSTLGCLALSLGLLTACQSKSDEESNQNNLLEKPPVKAQPKSENTATVASAPIPNTTLNIAASPSLKTVMPILTADFSHSHPNIIFDITYNSAINHYQQILNEPTKYDIFLSANQLFAKKLYDSTGGSRKYSRPFTFAQGQLVLYSNKHPIGATPNSTLDDFSIDHPNFSVAIADPSIVPYGSSAQIWLVNQNLSNTLSPNLVVQPTIDETFSKTDSGDVDFGFVALSQVLGKQQNNSLRHYNQSINYLILPRNSYPAILQDGIVLKPSAASTEFTQYLLTAKAQDILTDAGFLPVCITNNLLPACKTATSQ